MPGSMQDQDSILPPDNIDLHPKGTLCLT